MSEYRYYEFVAVDRPLDDRQQAEVRALSSRAHLTDTAFVDEYEEGDFPGDPGLMVERYYDAHVYLTNWGTRRFVLRLPKHVLAVDTVEEYCLDGHVAAWTSGGNLVLDLTSEDEEDAEGREPRGWLPLLLGIRAELAAGDLRPLYLAWLAGYGTWERDEWAFDRAHDDEPEPPVPPGLTELTVPQRGLADFLRLDEDLLHVASAASPPLASAADDPHALVSWIAGLPVEEKDRLLVRVAGDEAAVVRMELLHRFRGGSVDRPIEAKVRTVADLLDGAGRYRTEREHREVGGRTAEPEKV